MKSKSVSSESGPIEEGCPCLACTKYSRAQLSALFRAGSSVATQLVTLHNISYMMRLMRRMRASIMLGTFASFVDDFLRTMFFSGEGKEVEIPGWVKDALAEVGIATPVSKSLLCPRSSGGSGGERTNEQPEQQR